MEAGPATQPSLVATALRASLMWSSGIGAATFRDLLVHFGSDEAICAATPASICDAAPRLTADQATTLNGCDNHTPARAREILRLARRGISVVSDAAADYPARLYSLNAPPPLLCIRGRIPETPPAVTIVGTRSPTSSDYEMAYALAVRCAERGVPVVSGLALGIDTAAHLGALEAGGLTVAVLGSGILNVYPQRNLALADRIASQGAIISETAPLSRVSVASLMARNRITAALGSTLIVIASGIRGGSMATARHAIRLGIRVAAVAWDDVPPRHEGNQELLRAGATPLRGPDDIDALLSATSA